MRGIIRIGQDTWQAVCAHLHGSRDERMAYLLARASRFTDPQDGPILDLLVTRALPIPDAALTTQTGVRVEIDPGFTREVLIACYETGLSLIDVHTHPFATDTVFFSGHDMTNMRTTHADFLRRLPIHPPTAAASLVLGRQAVAGAYTNPDNAALYPLDRMLLLGDALSEVPL